MHRPCALIILRSYRRQTGCEYSTMASTIATTDPMRRGKQSLAPRRIEAVEKLPRSASASVSASTVWTSPQEPSPHHLSHGDQLPPTPPPASALPSETASLPVFFPPSLVHASYDRPALFTLFGMSRQHPFRTLSLNLLHRFTWHQGYD